MMSDDTICYEHDMNHQDMDVYQCTSSQMKERNHGQTSQFSFPAFHGK